eukprot:GHVH01002759.1.p1 GENE.GHVH01002759.1~~GHVH01002759.1.p1  ORF type:complete len:183 (-),score=38.33 GHVH01002759.1:46-528(-)
MSSLGGGNGQMPNLNEMMSALGGGNGQMPNLNEMVSALGGGNGQMPNLNEMVSSLGGGNRDLQQSLEQAMSNPQVQAALQNPNIMNMISGLQNGQTPDISSLMSGLAGGANPPHRSASEAAISQLKEMGYGDREKSEKALRKSGGDVSRALDYLMEDDLD